MTDSASSAEQRQYAAEFSGGPLDGTTEHRYLVDGEVEGHVLEMALVLGTEGLFRYNAGDRHLVGDVLHVTFTYDPEDSDVLRGQADPESESKSL